MKYKALVKLMGKNECDLESTITKEIMSFLKFYLCFKGNLWLGHS